MFGIKSRPRGESNREVARFNFNILIDGPPTVEIASYGSFRRYRFSRKLHLREMSIGTDERFCGEMKNRKTTHRDGSARVFHEAKFESREFLEEKRRFIAKRKYKGRRKGEGKGEEEEEAGGGKKSIAGDTSETTFRFARIKAGNDFANISMTCY